jgi:FkbM family methyltransferase
MTYIKEVKNIIRSINQHPLAGRHRLKAYSNFVSWQIFSRIKRTTQKIKFTEKTVLMVKRGMEGATGNIYMGLHEFDDMGFLLHFLRKEDLFLDIGANICSYTILASGHAGAKSISFEPIPSTFRSLEKNISANNLKNKVQALQVGVGSENGTLTFTSDLDCVNHVAIPPTEEMSPNNVQVNVVNIDDVLKNVECPSMIKIDVEGFETEVLNGMDKTLKNHNLKAILIELNGSGKRYGYDEVKIHELLLRHGFKAYSYEPFTRKITFLETFGLFNTLYLRDLDFIKNRISIADKVRLFNESF